MKAKLRDSLEDTERDRDQHSQHIDGEKKGETISCDLSLNDMLMKLCSVSRYHIQCFSSQPKVPFMVFVTFIW